MSLKKVSIVVVSSHVLNGDVLDQNGPFLHKYSRELALEVVQTMTVRSRKDNIKGAVEYCRAMSDLVFVVGGIGPAAEDVTYNAVGEVFDISCELNNTTWERMMKLSDTNKRDPTFSWTEDTPKWRRKRKMATLPIDPEQDEEKQLFFTREDEWTPLLMVRDQVLIGPGVPDMLASFLRAFRPVLARRVSPEALGQKQVNFYTWRSETEYSTIIERLNSEAHKSKSKIVCSSFPDQFRQSENLIILNGPDKDALVEIAETIRTELEDGWIATEPGQLIQRQNPPEIGEPDRFEQEAHALVEELGHHLLTLLGKQTTILREEIDALIAHSQLLRNVHHPETIARALQEGKKWRAIPPVSSRDNSDGSTESSEGRLQPTPVY